MGLFRTEFLYLDRDDMPTKAEQVQAYRQVFELMSGRPLVVRTLDIGGDKPAAYLDVERRVIIGEVESARAQQNKVTAKIAELKKAGQDASEIIAEMKELSSGIKALDDKLRSIETQIHDILIWIPNVPHPSAPVGGEEQNEIIKHWGQMPEMDFKPMPHYEIAEKLNIIDFARASRMSGSFFVSYRGLGARLERALINFMIDLHIDKHGYTEVFPPFITKREAMFGTGQ
ncbi:MAG TPA: hypothetical protein EYP14_00980, partial [Planctomycetaceae bacterium]|nr:hypothetical protein [Planctomycetaceae bacterium]